METVVVEEKIYDSKINVRDELINIRKAFPLNSIINSNFNLATGQTYVTSSCTFFHFHSAAPIQAQIKKDGQLINLDSTIITISGKLDQVTLTNNQDTDTKIYVTYAC